MNSLEKGTDCTPVAAYDQGVYSIDGFGKPISPKSLAVKSREIADLTRQLSRMTLDLVREGRETIRSTREKIQRSRQRLERADIPWEGLEE